MNKILIVGDSHTDVFIGLENSIRFSDYNDTITGLRFTQYQDFESYTGLWGHLDKYFTTHGKDSCLLLCVQEIDIRGHDWRHLPVFASNGGSIKDYFQKKGETLFDTLNYIKQKYELHRIIVWGPPPAQDNKNYNPTWPFVGNTATRNAMVHLFNSVVVQAVESSSNIAFATEFYSYIDPKTYLPSKYFSHDGVHWDTKFQPELHNLVNKVINGNLSFNIKDDTNWKIMENQEFQIISQEVDYKFSYDAWIQQPHAYNNVQKTLTLNEQVYNLVHIDTDAKNLELALVPVERFELPTY